MAAIGGCIATYKPDLVIVQGDTTSTMCGALAAFYAGVEVAHVEAGLRTGDLYAPFPEEFNRVVVGRVARMHFAATTEARANLLREGSIITTPAPPNDAADRTTPGLGRPSFLVAHPRPTVALLLVTAHRRENHAAPWPDRGCAQASSSTEDVDILSQFTRIQTFALPWTARV